MVKLALIFGGNAPEHDISIITAYQVKKQIIGDYHIELLYVGRDGMLYYATKKNITFFQKSNYRLPKANFINHGFVKGLRKHRIDCALIAMHGVNGEDGTMAGVLKYHHIPFVGSSMFASSLFMDKNLTHLVLKDHCLVTKSMSYTRDDFLASKPIDILPCIIKPNHLGSSIGISRCFQKSDLFQALNLAFCYDEEVIIEELLTNFKEYNVAVAKNAISYVEKISNDIGFFSFEKKYEDTFKFRHHIIKEENDLTLRIKAIAREIYDRFIKSGIVRYDFLVVEDKIYLGEVNTIPGALALYLFPNFNEILQDEINNAILTYDKIRKLEMNTPKAFLLQRKIEK